jgi:cytochrome c-type biogenesis protein CcmF
MLAFALTIFGTFLTRSGILSSIHAFGSGPVGMIFLGFLGVVVLASGGLLAWRSGRLREQPQLDSMVSREAAFLYGNVVLVAALFTIFLGTVFPLLSEAVAGVKVSVGAPYFNGVTAPLFIVLLFLMAVGPLVAWRRASWDNLRRNFVGPASTALVAATGLAAWGIRDAYPLLALTLCVLVGASVLLDTQRAVRARMHIAGESALGALGTITQRNQRRYGGFIVHLGVVLIVMGIAASMSYSVEREATLDVGQSLAIGRYRLTFEGLRGSQQPTHVRVEGLFRAFKDGVDVGVLTPTLKYFPTQQSPVGRAVMRISLTEDLYVILSGFSDVAQRQATLKVLVRPMVAWIWLGGAVLVLGTLITVWPFAVRVRSAAPAAEVAGGPVEPAR